MNEIEAGALAERRNGDGDGLRIVDVRSPDAFRRGHIPGSVNVPMNQLADRAEELAGAETVVTVCPHGQASLQAARVLAAYEGLQDAEVCSLSDGLTGWDGEMTATETTAETGTGSGDAEAPF